MFYSHIDAVGGCQHPSVKYEGAPAEMAVLAFDDVKDNLVGVDIGL